jgi:hypothetical protein
MSGGPAVNFVDATFVRLADPASRAGVFDEVALEQLVRAAYDADSLGVEGPFQPLFEEFRLGPSPRAPGLVEGVWNPVGGVARTELNLRVLGLAGDPTPRVDALWRGAIVTRVAVGGGRIADVEVAWPSPSGIDDQIVADLGALPDDPAVLEAERRRRFLDRLEAAAAQPQVVGEAALDAWLARLGVATVGDLLAATGVAAGGAVQITFDNGGPVQPTPRPLPLTALLLVREAGFSVAELVSESTALRERVGALGLERPADATLPRRSPILVVWVVPPEVFDDPDWPGGESGTPEERRAARRAAAGAWLAGEGIGLATAAPP